MSQLFALSISLVTEVFVIFLLVYFTLEFSSLEIRRILIVAFAATLFTHTFAWQSNEILLPYLVFPLRAMLIEMIVVIVEGVIYRIFTGFSWWQSLFLSFLANATSFLVGLTIY
ncbi:MAG: hypothetical protein KME64_29310 [Scytonematopsis contorta HA4267-MV1]|jgi:hypothetical protein|nr:hypothetical protein [Scytonematopsis contorta HA4267-MV1]